MTVFQKFGGNPWVMIHFFVGLLAVVLFAFNFLNKKGSRVHRFSGRIYLFVYFFMILLGLIAGILHEFYEDRSIKLMLWAQSYFTAVLIVHAWFSARSRSVTERSRRAITVLFILALPLSVITAAYGLYKAQSVSTSLGLLLILLTGRYLGFPHWHSGLRNPIYQHASAMGLSGLFLLFNASGFFGIHHVMDRFGEVSWARSLVSFGLFLLLLVAGEFYLFYRFRLFASRKKKPAGG